MQQSLGTSKKNPYVSLGENPSGLPKEFLEEFMEETLIYNIRKSCVGASKGIVNVIRRDSLLEDDIPIELSGETPADESPEKLTKVLIDEVLNKLWEASPEEEIIIQSLEQPFDEFRRRAEPLQ